MQKSLIEVRSVRISSLSGDWLERECYVSWFFQVDKFHCCAPENFSCFVDGGDHSIGVWRSSGGSFVCGDMDFKGLPRQSRWSNAIDVVAVFHNIKGHGAKVLSATTSWSWRRSANINLRRICETGSNCGKVKRGAFCGKFDHDGIPCIDLTERIEGRVLVLVVKGVSVGVERQSSVKNEEED